MNIQDIRKAPDDAAFTISGADLKQLLSFGMTMNSGLAPKGEMCFLYGQTLIAIAQRAEPLP